MPSRAELLDAYREAVEAGDEDREMAATMSMLMLDLRYPPSADGGGIVELSYVLPSVAKHLTRVGWRWQPDRAKIKARPVPGPGVYSDAVAWVGINEPDDPLEDLENMSMAEINQLPEDLRVEARRRLGMIPAVHQPESQLWSEPNKVNIADAPDPDRTRVSDMPREAT